MSPLVSAEQVPTQRALYDRAPPRPWAWLVPLLYAVATTTAQAAEPPCKADAIGRFAELRKIEGHFDGGPWRAEVDKADGEKHRLMKRLAGCARAARADAAGVRRLLGEPEARLEPGAQAYASTVRATRWQPPRAKVKGTLWVYRWRGVHDFLLVAFDRGRVSATGWWEAGE